MAIEIVRPREERLRVERHVRPVGLSRGDAATYSQRPRFGLCLLIGVGLFLAGVALL